MIPLGFESLLQPSEGARPPLYPVLGPLAECKSESSAVVDGTTDFLVSIE